MMYVCVCVHTYVCDPIGSRAVPGQVYVCVYVRTYACDPIGSKVVPGETRAEIRPYSVDAPLVAACTADRTLVNICTKETNPASSPHAQGGSRLV